MSDTSPTPGTPEWESHIRSKAHSLPSSGRPGVHMARAARKWRRLEYGESRAREMELNARGIKLPYDKRRDVRPKLPAGSFKLDMSRPAPRPLRDIGPYFDGTHPDDQTMQGDFEAMRRAAQSLSDELDEILSNS